MALLLAPLALILLLVSPAYATTLEITGGFISATQQGGNASTTTSIGGVGFWASAFDDDHEFFLDQPSGGVAFSHIAGNSPSDMSGFVRVGAETCGGGANVADFYFCGSLAIFAPDIPLSERVLGASSPPLPFTATGHFNVGAGYDVVGQGTVIATYNSFSRPDFHYTFAVPEPSTLALLVTGLGLVACAWRRRQA